MLPARILVKRGADPAAAALSGGPSIVWGGGGVQGPVQLAVTQHRAHVAASLRIWDQLDEPVGVVGTRPRQPARDRDGAGVVCGDRRLEDRKSTRLNSSH